MDCLDFVQNGSRVAAAPGGCCSALKKVVKTEASCLCESFKSSADFGVALNMTRALSLPSSCGISIPFLGDCKSKEKT
ncbi:unnamed protein product [Spirodela intermedia]|uniref:Bifunctional inhibitor/plant lipid transfer protein/seed storage helical domain-containing protein n=1 Tax=Spirodela intermedia TaxID=51605 RepID=A0A7I8J4B1_SPIIN|nr:unnamed protein product [Spirodela intermedia]CAA6665067.1 unnamed protein product [Spirodela intermedia]